MRYLLSGDDLVSLRSFLIKLQSQYQNKEVFSPKKASFDLSFLKERRNLFGEKLLVIVENYLPKEDNLDSLPAEVDIVFCKTGGVEKIPNWVDKHLNFKLPNQVNAFRLSDCVGYRQEKLSLTLLEKLFQENIPSEIIIGSLVREFRLISLVLAGELEKVSTSPFLQRKIREQANYWDKKKVKKAILRILKVDWGIKTGQSESQSSLTLLISSLCSS